jgi:hypothetical protein
MHFDDLNDDNVFLYAVKSYEKPNCIMSEFDEDFKRFSYIKRLLNRHRKYGEVKERLMLNHLVVLYNVFGIESCTRLLFYFVDEIDYSALKTYLIFLNYMPKIVKGINNNDIHSADIILDQTIITALRNIK